MTSCVPGPQRSTDTDNLERRSPQLRRVIEINHVSLPYRRCLFEHGGKAKRTVLFLKMALASVPYGLGQAVFTGLREGGVPIVREDG
jgi:hypothetical protein